VSTKRALGRGLNTLLPPRTQTAAPPVTVPDANPVELPIDRLVPNPFQPRRHFDEQALEELAQSIRMDGVIQPLLVRRQGDRFEIIAGERRWRASRLAGLEMVPVYVQETPDDRMLEVALIENIQREDLNPMETATAFHRLNDELSLTHEEIAQRTGKDRATVSNFIRLLQLPDEVQAMISEKKISPGHARPLLRLTNASAILEVANRIIENEWSVRQVESTLSGTKATAKAKTEPRKQDPNVKAAVENLERTLGTRVRIVERGRGKGRFEIDYFSAEDLDRIYSMIVKES
jgi:ParB family chromosome partitioning protein